MEEDKEPERAPKVPKTFLTVGPTLHYSHRNVQFYWLLAAFMFSLACLFWSRVVTGQFWAFDFASQGISSFWELGRGTDTGVSLFEYPWQIIVLGLLMGILAVVPVLTAQLMSFGHSFIFVVAVFFLANLPGFAVFLIASCLAAAARPLRFRSRITAIALCLAPQLVYWGAFGGARGVEPLEWGFSFAPWIWAWLTGMTIAGLVLGIGHYTRYKPGLIWVFTTTTLLLALGVFVWKIGFDELDYHLHVAKNNPEEVAEFRDRSIREVLDRTITDPREKEYRMRYSYPTEPIPLREELKREIQIELIEDRWPSWLILSDDLLYQDKRDWLSAEYDRFLHPPRPRWMPAAVYQEIVARRNRSSRMPIALYFKALLYEYSPDLRRIQQDETLHFYSDYPQERASRLWFRLYNEFGRSPESAEARWRGARQLAGQKELQRAAGLLDEADALSREQLAIREKAEAATGDSLFSAFQPPADTVMTSQKLRDLRRRIHELRSLIGEENLAGPDGAIDRLAAYIQLNPHSLDYERQLDVLLAKLGEKDPLRDNLLLEKAKLIADDQRRAERLGELSREFQNTDGGMQALYELSRLTLRLYQRDPRKENLVQATNMLTSFRDLYPESFYTPQVKKNLDELAAILKPQ
ncbi:MAG TPA: hypothetical protein PKH24_01960 [Sedimentisphaerales bacterium]|jgi:hypothetical protein|nr:hypothetical protein [Sedimentisphaerales bacterium]HNU28228.1 hypothetical protein [Sedimentisphaerales bacterium]